jgi:hypothetical protein
MDRKKPVVAVWGWVLR